MSNIDHYERIYGFTDMQSQIDILSNKKYGLAYYIMLEGTSEWQYWTGSFVHILGVYKGVYTALEQINISAALYTVFYELDENNKPIRIIPHAVCKVDINKDMDDSYPLGRNLVRQDLTTRYDFNNCVPPVELDRFAE
jgi:hypothetical protein